MQSLAKSVDDYLKEVPEMRRASLEQLRGLCLDILEDYEESMEYGMPSYKKHGGEVEVAFASHAAVQNIVDRNGVEIKR